MRLERLQLAHARLRLGVHPVDHLRGRRLWRARPRADGEDVRMLRRGRMESRQRGTKSHMRVRMRHDFTVSQRPRPHVALSDILTRRTRPARRPQAAGGWRGRLAKHGVQVAHGLRGGKAGRRRARPERFLLVLCCLLFLVVFISFAFKPFFKTKAVTVGRTRANASRHQSGADRRTKAPDVRGRAWSGPLTEHSCRLPASIHDRDKRCFLAGNVVRRAETCPWLEAHDADSKS